MKKIKFPLEMKNGKMVREMEEFQEYFDLKKALGYFANGRLQKWLENNYENDILEELEELTGEEDDFLQRFLDILGIECREDNDLEVQKVFKESVIKERLKRVLPEKEIEEKAEKTRIANEAKERKAKLVEQSAREAEKTTQEDKEQILEEKKEELIRLSHHANLKNNPVEVTDEDLRRLYDGLCD